jgi:hypothetical protein
MIVSVTRRRNSPQDNTCTCQFPLSHLGNSSTSSGSPSAWLKSASGDALRSMIISRLGVSLTDMSVVWRLSESGQMGTINDRESMCAAILDHQNAGKYMIQLYVAKASGMAHIQTKHDSLDSLHEPRHPQPAQLFPPLKQDRLRKNKQYIRQRRPRPICTWEAWWMEDGQTQNRSRNTCEASSGR